MPASRTRPRVLPLLLAFILGVVLAGGSAYAAPLTSAKVKKIAAKVVKSRASTLTVARATTADRATSAGTVVGYEVVERVDTLSSSDTTLNLAQLSCPAGKRAVGGGAVLSSFQAVVSHSGPTKDGTAWDVDIVRLSGSTVVTITVRVICLPV